jgi:hypothetical protein
MIRTDPFASVNDTPVSCNAKKSLTVEVIALGGSVDETFRSNDKGNSASESLKVNLTFFVATEVVGLPMDGMPFIELGRLKVGLGDIGLSLKAGLGERERLFLLAENDLVSVNRVRISIACLYKRLYGKESVYCSYLKEGKCEEVPLANLSANIVDVIVASVKSPLSTNTAYLFNEILFQDDPGWDDLLVYLRGRGAQRSSG